MSNKQQLQSAGDGTAVPAGYVGETKTGSGGVLAYGSMSTTTYTDTGASITDIGNGVWLIWGVVRATSGGTDLALPGICEVQMVVGATTYAAQASCVYDNSISIAYSFSLTFSPEVHANSTGVITAKLQARRPSGVFDILSSKITAVRIA